MKEFSGYAIAQSEPSFSDWLKSDQENELSLHFEENYINQLMGVASRLKAWRFGLKRLINSYEGRNETPPIDIKEALKILYQFGIVGQFYQSEDNIASLNFYYNDGDDVPYLNPNFFINDFIIHRGLQPSLLRGDVRKANQLYK